MLVGVQIEIFALQRRIIQSLGLNNIETMV